jgi:hypothetical protein
MTYKRRAMMPSINKARKSEIMSSGTMRSSIMRSESRIKRSSIMRIMTMRSKSRITRSETMKS